MSPPPRPTTLHPSRRRLRPPQTRASPRPPPPARTFLPRCRRLRLPRTHTPPIRATAVNRPRRHWTSRRPGPPSATTGVWPGDPRAALRIRLPRDRIRMRTPPIRATTANRPRWRWANGHSRSSWRGGWLRASPKRLGSPATAPPRSPKLPAHWPADYRTLVERRIELIHGDRFIGLLEKPEYKPSGLANEPIGNAPGALQRREDEIAPKWR